MNIQESALSIIKNWINTKEIAGITASRHKLVNVTSKTLVDKKEGEEYTRSENSERNKGLKAALLRLGYGVTTVTGPYLEGGGQVQEESYIVVNLKDDPSFKKNLLNLSEYHNQDTFLYKP